MRVWLTATASATLAVLVLMVGFTAAGAPSGDTVAAQLASLREDPGLYPWGFFFASLVPAAAVPFMAGVALLAWRRAGGDGARSAIVAGLVLVAAYAPLSAAAYASQYTVVDWLLRRDLSAAALWYFNNGDGAPLTFDLLAYAIWGTGALLLVSPLMRSRGALAVLAGALALSGLLSIVAFGLHALGSDAASAVSTVSGALIVPAAVAALVVARPADEHRDDERDPSAPGPAAAPPAA
jgi:hypothetical protein